MQHFYTLLVTIDDIKVDYFDVKLTFIRVLITLIKYSTLAYIDAKQLLLNCGYDLVLVIILTVYVSQYNYSCFNY